MRPPKLIEVTDIPLDDIDCTERLRPVTAAAVDSLKASIETLGLQSEIHVRKVKKSGALRLIAGGHRMEAFRQLGRATIPAKVWDCTDDWADLAEIDDNLAHAELDALELAVFLARRKEVYERAYPETKRGSAGGRAKNGVLTAKLSVSTNATDNLAVASFVTSSASKLGASERNIRRIVAAGQALGPNEIRRLRNAPRKVTLSDLQTIAKCGAPTERRDIVSALANGTARSARDALTQKRHPGAAVKDPVEKDLKKISDAFARASKEAQRRFVRAHSESLHALLTDIEGGT